MFQDVRADVRIALRTLGRNPGFSAVVLALLSLGIGANAAIFSLMDQALLRHLPVRNPRQLVIVDAPGPFSGMSTSSHATLTTMSHPAYERLRDGTSSVFSGVLASFSTTAHLTVGNNAEQVTANLVSGTYFDVLGLSPHLGRLIGSGDDRTPGGHPHIVLGHAYWSRRFAANPSVVGQEVVLNGQAMTVVGVAPRGYHGLEVGDVADIYVPLMMQKQLLPTWPRGLGDWRARWLIVMARLKDGVTAEQATPAVNVLYQQMLHEDMSTIQSPSERFKTLFMQKKIQLLRGGRGTSSFRDDASAPLAVLMGMVGLVLLIACANVANLLLARASSRQKEIAVRLAIGASRARLVRQLLVESVIFAGLGGLLGLLVAFWTGRLLLQAMPSEAARLAFSADPDARMVAFAFGLSLLTGVAFGLVPALQSTRPQLAPTLKDEGSAVIGGGGAFRFRKGLVVAQIALSVLLLVGAGLFTRSLLNLRSLNPGFSPDQLIAFTVDPSLNGYPNERRLQVLGAIVDEVETEPGVRSAALAQLPLMTGNDSSSTVRVDGYTAGEDEDMNPRTNTISPRFFETLGMPIASGRDFTDADVATAPKVVVVNEEFARYFYKGADPIGRRIAFGRGTEFDHTIVGVVRDGKASSLREKPVRFVYFAYMQRDRIGSMTTYVRADVPPETLGERLRRIVQRLDPMLPLTDLKTMQAQIRESLFTERLVATLSMAFGILATLLASVGLYGVTSHAVSQRTREIGIRVALGAARETILTMVLSEVALLAGIGVLIGLPSGYVLGRLVEAELYGLTALDPLTFVVAASVLVGVSLLAGYVPAARAMRVDPMVALRYQ